MKVIITTKDPIFLDYPTTTRTAYENVWEIQDNGHKELVIKFNDHSCKRIDEVIIEHVEIKF